MIYFVKGALERILSKCTHFYNDGTTSPLHDKQRTEYTQEAVKMGMQGLRGMYHKNLGTWMDNLTVLHPLSRVNLLRKEF